MGITTRRQTAWGVSRASNCGTNQYTYHHRYEGDHNTAANCIECATGGYSASAAADSCTNRGTSQYTNGTTAAGHNAGADCKACSVGRYPASTAADSSTNCGTG